MAGLKRGKYHVSVCRPRVYSLAVAPDWSVKQKLYSGWSQENLFSFLVGKAHLYLYRNCLVILGKSFSNFKRSAFPRLCSR